MLEKLRKELHDFIESYGFLDYRTIAKSQELDLEVNKDMLKRRAMYACGFNNP